MDERGVSNQVIFGIILLIIGALFFIDTTNIYDTSGLLIYIPSLFILLGIWALYKNGLRNPAGPVILILIFGVIQLELLDLLPGLSFANLWPLILIIIGIGILLNKVGRPSREKVDKGEIDLIAILGGADSNITSDNLKGGDITAIMGGVNLDLRDSEVGSTPCEIDVFILFGGAEINVPEEWSVKMNVLPILGGASDERPRSKERKGGKESPDLIVSGFTAFGGVSVKD